MTSCRCSSRRHKLRIPRFRPRPKARPLHCASSPHKAKGWLCGGPLFSHAQSWQPDGGAEGKVRGMGRAAHEGKWERLNAQWSYDPGQNCFPLPHEVFELGLEQGALLVYLYLIYHKHQKHSTDKLSCAIISKAVGLCAKTVRRHLRTLANSDFIRMECVGKSFSYTLCPIRNNVKKRRDVDLFSTHEGGLSA